MIRLTPASASSQVSWNIFYVCGGWSGHQRAARVHRDAVLSPIQAPGQPLRGTAGGRVWASSRSPAGFWGPWRSSPHSLRQLRGPHFPSCPVLVWGIVATPDPRRCIMCHSSVSLEVVAGALWSLWWPVLFGPSCEPEPSRVCGLGSVWGSMCLQARGLSYFAWHSLGQKE